MNSIQDVKISTLEESPHYRETLIRELEEAFDYQAPHKVDVDFYPLFYREYIKDNYLLIEKKTEKLIGHIAARKKLLSHLDICTHFFGGIFIKKEFQGRGYFRHLFEYVLAQYKESPLFFLWSGHHTLYQKFGFTLAGTQFELSARRSLQEASFSLNKIEKTKLSQVSEKDFFSIKKLYKEEIETKFLSVKRSDADWHILKKIHSSDLYLKRDKGEVSAYAFAGKGQDMPEIIHEFVSLQKDKESFYQDLSFLTLWTSDANFATRGTRQGLALIKNNSQNLFLLEKLPPLYVSGLDSI